jgi:hypothetical protein
MVHRTDIAGGGMGRASPDCVRRHARNGPLLQNRLSPEPLPASHSANKKCCRFLAAAFPPVHAIRSQTPDLMGG